MSLEWEIHQKLLDEKSPKAVGNYLVEKWKNSNLSIEEKETIASYLIHIGAYASLAELFRSTIAQPYAVPWAHFLEFCREAKLNFDEQIEKVIIEGAEAQNQTKRIALNSAFDSLIPSLRELRIQLREQSQEEFRNRKKTLIEKIEFLKSQRMLQEEGRALLELMNAFPLDDFSALKQDYDERVALETLAHRSPIIADAVLEKQTPEDIDAGKRISSQVATAADSNPHLRYDLTVMLYFMELYAPALELIEKAEPNYATDWLQIELLVKSRLFVRVLEITDLFEKRYGDIPSTAFAASYARAQALYGLGQKDDATQLMQSIVKLRPKYRSARILLSDWLGGAN